MVVYLSLPQLTLHQKLTFHYLLTTRQQARFLHGRSREPGDVWNGYWGEEGPEEREASEGGRHAPQPLNRPRAATGPRPPGGRREGGAVRPFPRQPSARPRQPRRSHPRWPRPRGLHACSPDHAGPRSPPSGSLPEALVTVLPHRAHCISAATQGRPFLPTC